MKRPTKGEKGDTDSCDFEPESAPCRSNSFWRPNSLLYSRHRTSFPSQTAFYSLASLPATLRGLIGGFVLSFYIWAIFRAVDGALSGVPDVPRVRCISPVSPGFLDQSLEIIARPPAQKEFRFGVVQPSRVIGSFDLDRRESPCLPQIIGRLPVIHRLIHANVEGLLARLRMIERFQDGIRKIADVNEIAFDGMAIRIKHQGHRAAFAIGVGPLGPNEVPPARSAKNILAKGERVLEIILFHDPGGTQTASVQTVLDEILFQHHFFENLRECVAAWICGVLLLFGDGDRMRIEEMTDGAIAAEQDELLE